MTQQVRVLTTIRNLTIIDQISASKNAKAFKLWNKKEQIIETIL